MSLDMAMVAKAKARSSKHLSYEDYRQMINLHSVGEIAAYLKQTPRYQEVLEPVNVNAIHREYLEQRIRSQAQIDFNALLKFMKTKTHHFYEFYIKELEIHHILFVLHAIDANTKYHLGKFQMHLNDLMEFDLEELALCQTYDDVLKVMSGTSYESILLQLNRNQPDISVIEDQLYHLYNKTMVQLIEDESHHQEILDLFLMKLELNDIAHAYRLRKYFQMDPNSIQHRLNWMAYKISNQQVNEWINSENEIDFINGLNDSFYGKTMKIDTEKHIEYSFSIILYRILKQKMRTSNHSDVVLFSYMNLVDIEIQNIIDIIEGIRYSISKEDILELLIL